MEAGQFFLVPAILRRSMDLVRDTAAFLKRLAIGEGVLGVGFVILAGAVGATSVYGYTTLNSLSDRLVELDTRLASTTEILQGTIAETADALREQNASVAEKLDDFEDEVGDITGTIEDLEKLAKTDPELLAKYSKVFFLSEHYTPARLVEIPTGYKYSETRSVQVIPEILPNLTRLLDRAKRDGVALYVQSGYRSFETQEALKGQYAVTYGAGTANQFSADQGYSEHQLGTTVDFTTTGLGGGLTGFDRTAAYAWLLKNAYRYGFVLSYPQGNTYYIFEPWHWRFVGEDLADDLHDDGKNFYDLDQRDIDKYLISLFD